MATKVQLAQTQLVASQRLSMAEHRAEKALDALGQQRKKYKEERSQREQADQKLRHAESHRVAALRAQDEELRSNNEELRMKAQEASKQARELEKLATSHAKALARERDRLKLERALREAAEEKLQLVEERHLAEHRKEVAQP